MSRRPGESEALRALRESLTEEGGGHPAEELLLEYADKRSSLATDVVAGIDAHLAQCPSCRDEVGVLGSMTIRPIHVTSAAEAGAERSVWQRVVSALSGPVWRPALALAVLVVLMVPTLQLIGQDRGLLLDMVEQHDDVAMTVKEDRSFQASRAGDVQALNGMAAIKDERQARSDDEPRATTIAPTIPPAAPAPSEKSKAAVDPQPNAVAPVTPGDGVSERGLIPPAAPLANPAAPAPSAPIPDSFAAEGLTRDFQAEKSRRYDARASHAMRQQRYAERSPAPATFDYVPGGRETITADSPERILLRVAFVRENSQPQDPALKGQTAGGEKSAVLLGPTVTEVDVQVTAADGRKNARRVRLHPTTEKLGSSIVEIPFDWLATGDNQVEVITARGPRVLSSPFLIERR